jgi:hypothetical protein
MKNFLNSVCAAVLVGALCAGFAGCDEPGGQDRSGLGEEIPGIETKQATGTVIGRWADTGYGSFFVDVDEEFPIGKILDPLRDTSPRFYKGLSGDYLNVIQVPHKLPIAVGDRISFSFRECRKYEPYEEYSEEHDSELFRIGTGIVTMEHAQPWLPEYVLTKYEILNKN